MESGSIFRDFFFRIDFESGELLMDFRWLLKTYAWHISETSSYEQRVVARKKKT